MEIPKKFPNPPKNPLDFPKMGMGSAKIQRQRNPSWELGSPRDLLDPLGSSPLSHLGSLGMFGFNFILAAEFQLVGLGIIGLEEIPGERKKGNFRPLKFKNYSIPHFNLRGIGGSLNPS